MLLPDGAISRGVSPPLKAAEENFKLHRAGSIEQETLAWLQDVVCAVHSSFGIAPDGPATERASHRKVLRLMERLAKPLHIATVAMPAQTPQTPQPPQQAQAARSAWRCLVSDLIAAKADRVCPGGLKGLNPGCGSAALRCPFWSRRVACRICKHHNAFGPNALRLGCTAQAGLHRLNLTLPAPCPKNTVLKETRKEPLP